MAKREMKIWTADINCKFKNEKQAMDYAKKLYNFFRDTCKSKKNKDYMAQALIGVSNINGKLAPFVSTKRNGKRGKQEKVIETSEMAERILGNKYINWHIHIIVVSNPSETFKRLLKDYIDKNWLGVKKEKLLFSKGKVYKRKCNINFAEYILGQSERIRIFNNFNEELIHKDYTFRELNKKLMKMHNALKHSRNYRHSEELQMTINEEYYKIKRFYYKLTKEEDTKKGKTFMADVRQQKIEEKIIVQKSRMQKHTTELLF